MSYTGLLKRFIPFLLTFATGLLLASFFIPIGLPNMSSWRDSRRNNNCWREKQQLRSEIDELREQNRSLRKENEEIRRNAVDTDAIFDDAVPPVDLEAPHPPPPPRRPKHPRFDSGQ